MNASKLSKNQSTVPYFFAQKQKPQSSYQQYTQDSLEESVPEFKRNNNGESFKVES